MKRKKILDDNSNVEVNEERVENKTTDTKHGSIDIKYVTFYSDGNKDTGEVATIYFINLMLEKLCKY